MEYKLNILNLFYYKKLRGRLLLLFSIKVATSSAADLRSQYFAYMLFITIYNLFLAQLL